jgi:beta-lactamase regulating signal transducer with metallopeptidase domain
VASFAIIESTVAQVDAALAPWFHALADTAIQGAVFIAVVYLICRALPRLPASIRCWMWWLACLKLVIDIVWISPIDLQVLKPALLAAAPPIMQSAAIAPMPVMPPAAWIQNIPAGSAAAQPAAHTPRMRIPWLLLAAMMWLLGVGWRLVVVSRQFAQSRKLAGSASIVEGDWMRETGQRLGRRLRLSPIPRVYSSPDVASPVVLGFYEPIILIPDNDLYSCDNESLRLALAHEMAHIRRGDLWYGLVPSLAQIIFFFHPMAWLAAREYALCREEACDAEAIHLTGITAHDYGKLLLRFGVAGRPSGAVVGLGASSNAKLLKRRLESLRYATASSRRAGAILLPAAILVASFGLLPVRLVAQQQPSPNSGAAPTQTDQPIVSSNSGSPTTAANPGPSPAPDVQPIPPAAPRLPAQPTKPAATAVAQAKPRPHVPSLPGQSDKAKSSSDEGTDSMDADDMSSLSSLNGLSALQSLSSLNSLGDTISQAIGQALSDSGSDARDLLNDQSQMKQLTEEQRNEMKQAITTALSSERIGDIALQAAQAGIQEAISRLQEKSDELESQIAATDTDTAKSPDEQEKIKEKLAALRAAREGLASAVAGLKISMDQLRSQTSRMNTGSPPVPPIPAMPEFSGTPRQPGAAPAPPAPPDKPTSNDAPSVVQQFDESAVPGPLSGYQVTVIRFKRWMVTCVTRLGSSSATFATIDSAITASGAP